MPGGCWTKKDAKMIQGIDHIGIAVRSLAEAVPVYRDLLRLTYLGQEEVLDQKVRVAVFEVGEARIELLEPTSGDGPIASFIERHGPGIHHVAYGVDDLRAELGRLREQGVSLIDAEPRRGAGGSLIAFLHPRSTGRVLVELCEHSSGKARET